MWSTDDLDRMLTEVRIEQAADLPQVSGDFRARVLGCSVREQQQSLSSQRCQTAVTAMLAVLLLFGLSGYYQSLRGPMLWRTQFLAGATATVPSPTVPDVTRSSDGFEWALVESALAARDLSARLQVSRL